jgi:signal transduction histidine kinase
VYHQTADSTRDVAGSLSNGQLHAVQFYDSPQFLYAAVANFVGAGLCLGQPALIVARPENHKGFKDALDVSGIDVEAVLRSGDLVLCDAHEMLASFMRGSQIDEQRLAEQLTAAVQHMLRGRAVVIRAFGEMVDILVQDGNEAAAVQLESAWNQVSQDFECEVLCGYSIKNFYTDTHTQFLAQICEQHSRVTPAESFSLLTGESERTHKVLELQHRARVLEVEIEHRKAIERALRDAMSELQRAKDEAERANAAKSEFLAVISHELRTPLTAIIGYEELIAQGVGGPVTLQQNGFLAGIRSGASHLLRLVDQILTQSRLNAGKDRLNVDRVDAVALVASCAALMEPVAESKKIRFEVSLQRNVRCETDAGKLQQIILNLLSNALKFTDRGRVSVSLTARAGFAHFRVADTGMGIAAKDLGRIFEPFQQVDSTCSRRHSGVGLGLSVALDLATLLGGDIKASSTVGRGSIFTLVLPLAKPATSA